MPMTIRDLWLLRYNEHPPDLAGAVYTSDQIDDEIRRANLERRDGRADWTAIDLEEAMWMQPVRAGGVHGHADGMFVVTEADAAAIRTIFDEEGELSAAIELRRPLHGTLLFCDGSPARAGIGHG
jgi:hypothetical protein